MICIMDDVEWVDTPTAARLLGVSSRSLAANHNRNLRFQSLETRRWHTCNLWRLDDIRDLIASETPARVVSLESRAVNRDTPEMISI